VTTPNLLGTRGAGTAPINTATASGSVNTAGPDRHQRRERVPRERGHQFALHCSYDGTRRAAGRTWNPEDRPCRTNNVELVTPQRVRACHRDTHERHGAHHGDFDGSEPGADRH